MRSLAAQITSRGLNREDAREVRRQEAGPRVVPETKPYSFRYVSPKKDFTLELKFRRADISPEEVAAALQLAEASLLQNPEQDPTPSFDAN
jgi:hypothetical protein